MNTNRKGSSKLLDYVIGAVIVAIVFVIMIAVIRNLYSGAKADESILAQEKLDELNAHIELLADGQQGKFEISNIKSDKGYWAFVAWSRDDKNRPDICYFKSCLCICPNIYSQSDGNGDYSPDNPNEEPAKEICQSEGFCRLYDAPKVNIIKYFQIQKSQLGETPTDVFERVIRMSALKVKLVEIRISKSKDEISLFQ